MLPTILGGRDNYNNLQLLHRHCHDQKTAADGSSVARGTDDSSQAIEEPDEVTNLTSGSEAELPVKVILPTRPLGYSFQ